MKRIFTLSMLLLLVMGAANATVTAKWDFTSGASPRAVALFQPGGTTTGTVDSDVAGVMMSVDATTGKFDSSIRTGDVQFNSGSKIFIPVVSTKDKITIVGNYSVTYIIGQENSNTTDLNKEYTVQAADVELGYVTIESKADSYFYSIQVALAYMPAQAIVVSWDWANNIPSGIQSVLINGTTGTIESGISGIYLDVDATSGKLAGQAGSAQFNLGTKIKVKGISVNDVVTVTSHNYNFEKIQIAGKEYTDLSIEHVVTAADVAAGYVEIVSVSNTLEKHPYLVSIMLEKRGVVTVTDCGWATYSIPAATDFSALSGVVKAYIVTGNSGSAITTDDVTTAAANTGLLLNAAAGTYAIPLALSGTDLSSTNLLKAGDGSAVSAVSGKSRYVLSADGSTALFKKINTIDATVPAGKAYLEFDGTVPAPVLNIDFGGATAITNTNLTNDTNNGAFFDLQGRRVAQPTKGLYIVNGKKIVIK